MPNMPNYRHQLIKTHFQKAYITKFTIFQLKFKQVHVQHVQRDSTCHTSDGYEDQQ